MKPYLKNLQMFVIKVKFITKCTHYRNTVLLYLEMI